MSSKKYTRCLNCNTVNLNRDYCENCGESIDYQKHREQELQRLEKERTETRNKQKTNKLETFIDELRNHPNIILRVFGKLIWSVWVVGVAIIGFLAFVFAYLSL